MREARSDVQRESVMWRKKQMMSARDLQSCPHGSFRCPRLHSVSSGGYLMEHSFINALHHMKFRLCLMSCKGLYKQSTFQFSTHL